jgi:FkbM family methyltransferase
MHAGRQRNPIVERILKHINKKNGFFIEIGANDGITQSNTIFLERAMGWSGLLVEPSPHNYIKCRENRSEKNSIFCAACVGFDYGEQFVPIAYANLMSSPIGLESDIDDPQAHANSGNKFLAASEDVFVFGASAIQLNKLLDKIHAPHAIDFFSLDVEGAEIEVLKGVDHNKYRFRNLVVECRDIEKMTAYLQALDYVFVEKLTVHDYLFQDGRK